MPIDAVIWRVNVFEFKLLVSDTVLFVLEILLFSFTIFGRADSYGERAICPTC